jgi:circadian clock protein KaiC
VSSEQNAKVMAVPPEAPPCASTGIAGLDAILKGGFPREELHLVQGSAGTGKTTMGLQFLIEGVRLGEPALYLTLSQSAPHLLRIARSHGWSLDGITVHELAPATLAERIAAKQSILPTAEVKLEEAFRELVELVQRVSPRRAVIDSLTILQLIAGGTERYHREVVNLRQLFFEHGCTVLALADHPALVDEGQAPEVMFHPLSGCVINLDQESRVYGDARRRLRVIKARGVANEAGVHDLRIVSGGMQVYQRLGAYTEPDLAEHRLLPTQAAGLDALLGGGLYTGTSCLIVGPSGVGKSTLASLYVGAAALAGQHASVFLFDERPETYIQRAEALGIRLKEEERAGLISIQQLDPGNVAPGQFAQMIREAILERHTKVVVIDSVIGYFTAMGSAELFLSQLHELITYATRRGVLLILCGAQEGFMSIGTQGAVDVSYLSDAVVVLAFFETEAKIRRAISVVKKKHGTHAKTINELVLADGQINVLAGPITDVKNVLVPGRSAG